MLALLETVFDIIRLRKGPDAIPHSPLLLVMAVALWLIAGQAMTAMTGELDQHDFLIGTLTGAVGLACYAGLVVLAGKAPRLLQTMTAVLACGAVLSFLYIAGDVFLSPFLSENLTNTVITLILLWSVPVEGHIIARALDRHWYVGIVAATLVLVLQLYLYALLDPSVNTVN